MKTGIDGKRGMKEERDAIEHMWRGCGEMRERGREKNGEKY
jgi:hypothetical protein